jgi:MYXO-CTERM domain-containing protein
MASLRLATALLGASLMAAGPARADTHPTWIGDFTDFNSAAWRSHWGIVPDSLQCDILEGRTSCNWGYQNLMPVSDPGVPGGGQALQVTYPAPSGPPSCGCGLGGGQLYQDLNTNGLAELIKSPTIDFKYHYKFPVGFDFGKSTAGKMPGLYGGAPGCESGGQRCPKAWSTRYMWRGGSKAAPNGEIYFYTASGSGFGSDLGNGSWKFVADGEWHSIEQLVNLQTGKIVIWHDGKMAYATTQNFGGGTLSGIFFSTFHGGHDTSWSPSKLTTAQFAHFSLATDGPQTEDAPPPSAADAGTPSTPAPDAAPVPPAIDAADAAPTAAPPDAAAASPPTSSSPPADPPAMARPAKSGGCSYAASGSPAPLSLLALALLLRRRRAMPLTPY